MRSDGLFYTSFGVHTPHFGTNIWRWHKSLVCSLPHCQWHFKVLPYTCSPALFFRHKAAHGCWAIQQMFAFCICWLSHITQLLHSAGFCSVLSFHEIVPEFPAIISELKTSPPSTWYLYSANRIKNLSLLIFVFMDWKITQHFPTSFTYSLFVSCLFSTKGISLSNFFSVSIDMRKKSTSLQKFSHPPTILNILALLLIS